MYHRLVPGMAFCSLVVLLMAQAARADDANDYPTRARVDYVFACMKVNGETRTALEQCSCSIDVISSAMTYDRYEAAETIISLGRLSGGFGDMFRSPEQGKAIVTDLRRAQAEADIRCF